MSLFPANQAQLVRSSQKDEHYRSLIKNNVNEAFQSVAGESETLSEQLAVQHRNIIICYVVHKFSTVFFSASFYFLNLVLEIFVDLLCAVENSNKDNTKLVTSSAEFLLVP